MTLSRHSLMLACCYLLLHHHLVSSDGPCLRSNLEFSEFGWLTMVNHMRSSELTYFAFQDSHSLERRKRFLVSTLPISLSFHRQD